MNLLNTEKIVIVLGWEKEFTSAVCCGFNSCGYIAVPMPWKKELLEGGLFSKEEFLTAIREIGADMVFTFNFYIFVSEVCSDLGIPYISWIFDCPWTKVFHAQALDECNFIFIFDRYLYNICVEIGIRTVFYLPLPALYIVDDYYKCSKSQKTCGTDISFVGSLYNEKPEDMVLLSILKILNPENRAYIDALLKFQSLCLDDFFLTDCMERDVISEIYDADIKNDRLFFKKEGMGTAEAAYCFAESVLARKVSSEDRIRIIKKIGQEYPISVYTPNRSFSPRGVINMGSVDYGAKAADVYGHSGISINITMRSIHTGIPLRCFDIMGAGGFLLTDYQKDFDGLFTTGEDYDCFHSEDELMTKIDYYLSHVNERMEISRNGYEKVNMYHSCRDRIDTIINIVRNRYDL